MLPSVARSGRVARRCALVHLEDDLVDKDETDGRCDVEYGVEYDHQPVASTSHNEINSVLNRLLGKILRMAGPFCGQQSAFALNLIKLLLQMPGLIAFGTRIED